MTVYLLACAPAEQGGGVEEYCLTASGKLEQRGFYPCDRPMYAVLEKERLFVLLRQPVPNEANGAVFSMDLRLNNPAYLGSTQGMVPCHLCVDGQDCYIVNYLSGSLVRIGQTAVAHKGRGTDPVRQEMPHTHCVIFSPDRQYVLCCDLGLDTLFCYDRALKPVSAAKAPDGYGIRHAVFSKDGTYIYALSEMIPAIHVFRFDGGTVTFVKTYDIPCTHPKANGAAIRLGPEGEKLYISLREENALLVYALQGEWLQLCQKADCLGDSPRDFALTEDRLIVTNEKTDNAVVFSLKDGLIHEEIAQIHLPNPLCCVVGEEKEQYYV